MKKVLLLAFLLLGSIAPTLVDASCGTTSNCASSCSSGECCGCPCSGKTFFTALPLYQSYRPELWSAFRNDRMMAADDGIGGAFDFVGFGGQSTKGNELAAYFLPNCKQALSVSEVSTPNLADVPNTFADLDSTNFNIITVGDSFASTASFDAKQSAMGFGFHYKQGFWFNEERTKWWYVDMSSSVQQVKNTVTICENVTNNGGGADTSLAPTTVAVDSLTAAFSQAAWNFGKIFSGCAQKKTGLADIEFKIGRQSMWFEHCHLGGYVGALIPTGNKPKGVYVFEPIVGHNHHWGVLVGTEGGFEFWTSRCERWHASVEIAGQAQYLFRNTQTRSFDLKNRPWSRYQEVYANQAQAAQANTLSLTPATAAQGAALSTPGINVFTQRVKVQPGFFFNSMTTLLLTHECGFEAEIGYNLFAREGECVELDCPWLVGPAIKAVGGAGETAPVRDITTNFLLESATVTFADYNQSLIQLSDLDLNSAAHPNIMVNLIYGALSYVWDDRRVPMGINVGGSYEFTGRDFAVMKRWVAWGKFNIAF